jgi:hypothetical protein
MTPFCRRRKADSLKPSATNRGFCYSQVLTATVSLSARASLAAVIGRASKYPDRANFGQLAFARGTFDLASSPRHDAVADDPWAIWCKTCKPRGVVANVISVANFEPKNPCSPPSNIRARNLPHSDSSLATLDGRSLGKEPARILNKQKLVRTRG